MTELDCENELSAKPTAARKAAIQILNGDFPDPLFFTTGWTHRYQDRDQYKLWEEKIKTPGVFLVGLGKNLTQVASTAKIQDTFIKMIQAHVDAPNVQIAVPSASPQARKDGNRPIAYYAHNMSVQARDDLLRRQLLATSIGAAHVLHFKPKRTGMTIQLGDLYNVDTKLVAKIFRKTLRSPNNAKALLPLITQSFTVEHLAQVVSSGYAIEVPMHGDGGHKEYQYTITTNSDLFPTEASFVRFRKIISGFLYTTTMNGNGRAMPQLYCTICHYGNHPTGLCPYTEIPGWFGPGLPKAPAAVVDEDDEESISASIPGASKKDKKGKGKARDSQDRNNKPRTQGGRKDKKDSGLF